MPRTRSILIYGLGIALRRLPAFLWTYVLSFMLTALLCIPLKVGLAQLLDRSLAAQPLATGFDLGTAVSAAMQMKEGAAGRAVSSMSHASIPAYLALYFILVPGTLYCYVTRSRARLSTLLRQGVLHFWRFVRISLLTALAMLLLLVPLAALQQRWSDFVTERMVGQNAVILRFTGVAVLVLVASLLRLYFDLVEAYTVQLGAERRADGKTDGRVHKTLKPAFHLLRGHFLRAWGVFLLLAASGAAGAFFAGRTAMHMLAQPRVWPMFLVAQAGVLATMFARFWQRGSEVALIQQHPLHLYEERSRIPFARPVKPVSGSDDPQHIETVYGSDPLTPLYAAPFSPEDSEGGEMISEAASAAPDPIPNPEPAPPSLDAPDPGVFHHEPHKHDRES